MSAEVAKTSPGTTPQPIDQMWREMLPQLRTFVRRRIANPDRAEDLVAEIVLRIHQNVGTLDDQERLPNWVFRIARNAIIDEYRRAGRSREQLTATLRIRPVYRWMTTLACCRSFPPAYGPCSPDCPRPQRRWR